MDEDAPIPPAEPEITHLEPPQETEESTAGVFACPLCNEPVAIGPEQRGPFIDCPHCGGQFAIPTTIIEEDPEAQARAEEELESRARELDGMRIRQLSTGRRAAIRTQGYLVVALCGCVMGMGSFLWEIVKLFRQTRHVDTSMALMLLGSIGLMWGAIHVFRRWRAVAAELRQTALVEPTTPPDFSSLSDGSQQVKYLEDVK